MKRRTLVKVNLIVAVAAACVLAAWGILWAYVTMGFAAFITTVVAGGVTVLGFVIAGMFLWEKWGTERDAPRRGAHAGQRKPPAREPAPLPPEMLSAPVAAPPGVSYGLPAWAVQDGDGEPVPEVTHDEFAPMQSYDGHVEWSGGILLKRLAIAIAAVTQMRGLIGQAALLGAKEAEAEVQRLQEENRRLKDERDFPELVGPGFPDWRTGQFAAADLALVQAAERVADGDAEMVRAAMEQGGVA